MADITSLDKFRAPFGGQEIELQQIHYEAGGIPLLRIRIRERGARFTVFEIDPVTARRWGEGLLHWASSQSGEAGTPPGHPQD
jgi:hypothetical protein